MAQDSIPFRRYVRIDVGNGACGCGPGESGSSDASSAANRANASAGQAAASAAEAQGAATVALQARDEAIAAASTALQPGDVGTAAYANTDQFATAAQGALADTALQSADLGSAAFVNTNTLATAAQGALADTAVQPGMLGTAATANTDQFATAAQGALAGTALQPGASSASVAFQQEGIVPTPQTVLGKLRRWLTPSDFGAVGNGVANDTNALSRALARAQATGAGVDLEDGKTYLVSRVAFPEGAVVRGDSTIRGNGADPGARYQVYVSNNAVIEHLNVSTPGTETNHFVVEVAGSDVRIGSMRVTSDVERAGSEGIWIKGNRVTVGNITTRNILRPVAVYNYDTGSPTLEDITLGNIDGEAYIRGLVINNVRNVSVGNVRFRTGSALADQVPGHNGILLGSVQNARFGDVYIHDCGEHAVRVGGSVDGGGNTENVSFGTITGEYTGGSVFKVAPTPPEVARGISVVAVVGYDVGKGTPGGNKEVVRLSSFADVTIGSISASPLNTSQGAPQCLRLNSGRDLLIGDVTATGVDSFFSINQDTDMGTGDLRRVYVGSFRGVCTGTTGFSVTYGDAGRKIGDVVFGNLDLTGYTSRLGTISLPAASIDGPVEFLGRATGGVVPVIDGLPASPLAYVDIRWGDKRWSGGNAAALPRNYSLATTAQSIDLSATPTWFGDYCLSGHQIVPAAGRYGGAYSWTRNGSGRRGAAVALKQVTADEKHNGVAILTQLVGVTAQETLRETALFKHTGTLQLAVLSTFADNAAAITGGLEAGDLYKTATGEVRVRV